MMRILGTWYLAQVPCGGTTGMVGLPVWGVGAPVGWMDTYSVEDTSHDATPVSCRYTSRRHRQIDFISK